MRKSMSGPLSLFASIFSLAVAAGDLTEVVITANRVPESVDAALAATAVLTREQIQTRQAGSIEDLLQGVEGLSIGNSGGPGKLTSFFVRGADADHLLVLVDGVRIGSATAGTAALQNLPVEMIERIEFVRGPRSSLYGSEAIGGVLQIFTRRQPGGGFKPEVALTSGSLATRRGYAALAGGDDHVWVRVQASAESTRGFDACRGSSTQFAGCFTEESDADGYRYGSGSVAAGWQVDEHTAIEGNLLRASSHAEYDGSWTNESHILQQVAGVSASRELGADGRLQFSLGRAWDRSRDYQGDNFVGRFETRRDSASLQWNVPLAAGRLLTLGVDHQRDHVASDTAYVRSGRNNTALFAQIVGDAGRWRTEVSLRGDDNAQFGQYATGTAAIGYAWSDALQLLAQAGTGFKAPSFNDLYYPFFGNPALDPERSRSFELALRGHGDAARWRVSLFATRFRDLIGLDANFLPANIDAARVLGIEAGTGFKWRGLRVETGATWQDAEPAMAAKLLQMANSAALNPNGNKITELKSAIARIGLSNVRSASLAYAMDQIKNAKELAPLRKPLHDLWERSVRVAAMSYVVARSWSKVNADQAMLAGLMHGMGRVYILTRAVKHPGLFNDPTTYHQIVRDWNAQVAKAVLESWEISPDIIDAVENYEILDRAGTGEVDLTDVLTIANVLVSFHTDLPALEMRLKETSAAVRLGVNAEAVQKVLQETVGEIASLRSALGG